MAADEQHTMCDGWQHQQAGWSMIAHRSSTLALALTIDWLLGEPPNRLHPVVWFGNFIHILERYAPRNTPVRALVSGAGMATAGTATAIVFAVTVERMVRISKFGTPALYGQVGQVVLLAALLKPTFAWRALIQAGEQVRGELAATRIDGARQALRALVSRDTTSLDTSLLAAAAIESLAENASDSVVAPLLYYQLFGFAGACVYRAVNTMDAMLGYRGEYEYLGKVPARLDDAVNWLPARITGLAIVGAAVLVGASPRQAWNTMWRDHQHTASPNAGYPMSAIAGALDICLEKTGHYRLNAEGRAPTHTDIRRTAQIVTVALSLVLGVGLLASVVSTFGNKHRDERKHQR